MKAGNHPTATEKQFEKFISIILRIFGAVLIFTGVIYIICYAFKDCLLASDKLAEIFFLIMMGVGFAYPDLLKDQNKGLSTMRLVVFMMVNVICLLLLKTGWDKPDLGSIGINAYWMGIIAFVFGAKATQTYFESKLAVPPVVQPFVTPVPIQPSLVQTPDNSVAMINEAIRQNQGLKTQFTNIVDMMLGSSNQNGHNVFCVDIVLDDNNSAGIPNILPVVFNGTQHSIPTIIIPSAGTAVSNAHLGDSILNQSISGAPGTLGCILIDTATQQKYVLSACHVFSDDVWKPAYTGTNVPQNVITDSTTNEQIGFWEYGLMNSFYDIGYAQLDSQVTISPSGLGTPRDAGSQDILHKTPVTFSGGFTGIAKGNIYNTGATRAVTYGAQQIPIGNLILISNNGKAPSAKGDSGALVYTDDTIKNPIGLLIAADQIYSYVIPIIGILNILNKKIY